MEGPEGAGEEGKTSSLCPRLIAAAVGEAAEVGLADTPVGGSDDARIPGGDAGDGGIESRIIFLISYIKVLDQGNEDIGTQIQL